MMTLRKFLMIAAVLFCCTAAMSSNAWADAVPVLNSSFETLGAGLIGGGTGCGAYDLGPVPGWTISGTGGSFVPGVGIFSSIPDGSTIGWLNNGSMFQTPGSGLAANTAYTLTVFVGDRPGWAGNYNIALDLGGSSLCSFSGMSGAIAVGTFQAESCSFTAGSTVQSGNLSVVLTNTGNSGQFDFDNVGVTTSPVATPEPGSMLLLGIGLIAAFAAVLARGKGEILTRA